MSNNKPRRLEDLVGKSKASFQDLGGGAEPVMTSWWKPDQCPITNAPFFMWVEHPRDGWVPTYGGPFDSYTLPEFDGESYTRERFDHDEGAWVLDEVEDLGIQIVDDQLYVTETDPQPAQQGGAPETAALAVDMLEDYASALDNGNLDGAGHSTPSAIYKVIDLLSTNAASPGSEWVRCSDRLPTEADSDPWEEIYCEVGGKVDRCSVGWLIKCCESDDRTMLKAKWMPTNLKRPQPPREQEKS